MDGLFVVLGMLVVAMGLRRTLKPPKQSPVRVLMPPKRDPLDAAMFRMGFSRADDNPPKSRVRRFEGTAEDLSVEIRCVDGETQVRIALPEGAREAKDYQIFRDDEQLIIEGAREEAISRLNADLIGALGHGARISLEDGALLLDASAATGSSERTGVPKPWIFALAKAASHTGPVMEELTKVAMSAELHELRSLALEALHRSAESASQVVLQGLGDGDFRVRQTAAELLEQDLEKLCRDWASSSKERIALRCQAAIHLVQAHCSEQTVRLLVELYESSEPEAQTVVIESVDAFVAWTTAHGADHFHRWLLPCSPDTVDAVLGRFLKSPELNLRLGATAALGAHGSPAMVATLETLRGPRVLVQAGRDAADQIRARAGVSGALSLSGGSPQGALGIPTPSGALSKPAKER